MRIFLPPADANTETLNLIESTSDKETNIAAANGELATVKAADRARSDNSDAKRVSHNLTSSEFSCRGARAASCRRACFGLEVSGD